MEWNELFAGAWTPQPQRQPIDAAGDAGPWTALAHNTGRPFTDDSVPSGTQQVAYQVRAARGTRQSGWSEPGILRFVANAAADAAPLRIAA
ncbi:hypothetical protein [Phycisphaera mikurensis]|uniref:Uncharacterized protein n=1 Tax=Phycisphaera mikurensis (strain NBRC 102666 / KCTC 22515 / FYK2301M01) TaxID=1142394 RepID=I0IF08_PHYMF|nr:hypothetical protein [Phycisphaera mikurensis]MBB6441639.1 hypothetical protein [Phycisphaera mikurensis]BAM03846.1 hypothetical protein PSMK_16870 [Phycisphaera mikurensis NBRC 102666]